MPKTGILFLLLTIFLIYGSSSFAYNADQERIKKLKASAINGNSESCLALGNAYYYGSGIPKDYYSAFRWYFESADKGNPTAQFNLALCYDQGIGVEQNKIEALRWYNKAAENGVIQAKYNLAIYYKEGHNFVSNAGTVILNSDMPKAIKLLQECSTVSFAPANRELAKIYLNEKKSLKDQELGMKYLILASQGNDPEALYMIAKIKMENGTPVKEVFSYIKVAADNNVVDSFEYVGVCYETGLGEIKQDKELAIKYYTKAAYNNVISAQVRLGEYYLNGTIVQMNIWESIYWFQKAADQNDPYALFMLGSFAEQGLGEKADKKKALKYYMKSAKLGFPKAQFNLAMYYAGNNDSNDNDSSMAYLWLRKAALQDDTKAQKELGFYCIMGEGTKQNYGNGLNWLSLSRDKGDSEAAEFLDNIQIK